MRRYSWSALGTIWEVTCDNTKQDVLAAERLAGALQITLAELATCDALLLAGRVSIEVLTDRQALVDVNEFCEPLPSNDSTRWRLHLTAGDALDEDIAHVELTSAVIAVLLDRSLLPPDDFMSVIETAYQRGLWHKVLSARPYDEIANLAESEYYEAMAALVTPRPGDSIPLAPQPGSTALAEITTPAPGYDRDESLRAIAARYQNLRPIVRYTSERLAQDASFQATVDELRSMGWLDWHVLTAVANLVGNERARQRGIRLTPAMSRLERDRALSMTMRAEAETDPPVPSSLFTAESLQAHLSGAVLSTLATLGLSNNQPTPDFCAIFRFLGNRYHYWTDDVPHEPVLVT